MTPKLASTLVLSLLAALSSATAATFTFSGGNGSPLRITSDSPITFTLNQAYGEHYISIALEDVFLTDHAAEYFGAASNTFTLTSGSGFTAIPFEFQVAINNGSIGPRDINFSLNTTATGSPLISGTELTLSAGTIVSNSNYMGALPDAASFNVWVRHNNSGVLTPISSTVVANNAAAVPEPASFSVLAGLGALALGATRRRRQA